MIIQVLEELKKNLEDLKGDPKMKFKTIQGIKKFSYIMFVLDKTKHTGIINLRFKPGRGRPTFATMQLDFNPLTGEGHYSEPFFRGKVGDINSMSNIPEEYKLDLSAEKKPNYPPKPENVLVEIPIEYFDKLLDKPNLKKDRLVIKAMQEFSQCNLVNHLKRGEFLENNKGIERLLPHELQYLARDFCHHYSSALVITKKIETDGDFLEGSKNLDGQAYMGFRKISGRKKS